MAKFIEVTTVSTLNEATGPIVLNCDHIAWIRRSGDETILMLIDKDEMKVQETYDALRAKLTRL